MVTVEDSVEDEPLPPPPPHPAASATTPARRIATATRAEFDLISGAIVRLSSVFA
jgi:hypothetical protein